MFDKEKFIPLNDTLNQKLGSPSHPSTKRELTPQEIQQKIHKGLDPQIKELFPSAAALPILSTTTDELKSDSSPERLLISDKAALVAAIEADLPFLAFVDDGKQVKVCAAGFSKPTIIGLLYIFLKKFRKEAQ